MHAGLDGWVRDHRDSWVVGFQKNVYAMDVLMAELMGLIEGLELAK